MTTQNDNKNQPVITLPNLSDLIAVFEIARLGLAMVQDEIAEEMDVSDEEITRLREEIIYQFLGVK